MKIRNGFVSNSSSSSFLIVKSSDKDIDIDEFIKENYMVKKDSKDSYEQEEYEYNYEKINGFLKSNDITKGELFEVSVEWGGEEGVIEILDNLNIPYKVTE